VLEARPVKSQKLMDKNESYWQIFIVPQSEAQDLLQAFG